MTNARLTNAKNSKNDEFYTQLTDIETELCHYKRHFKNKTVYCNCDDPYESNFFRYFALNFDYLGLKRLIATCYGESTIAGRQLSLFDDYKSPLSSKTNLKSRKAFKIDISRDDPKGLCNLEEYEKLLKQKGIVQRLNGNGDFRSDECIELLKQADIVVTNPPFSLFREYLSQLMTYDKKFVIWGNNNSLKYKDIFPLIKEERIWLGYKANKTCYFKLPDHYEIWDERYTAKMNDGHKYGKVSAISVFTNLDIDKRHEPLFLYAKYDPSKYPKYDNFDAIDVSDVKEIPCDYDGIMGVPISFMDKYCADQFEIIGEANHGCDNQYDLFKPTINGKEIFPRILIRRKT